MNDLGKKRRQYTLLEHSLLHLPPSNRLRSGVSRTNFNHVIISHRCRKLNRKIECSMAYPVVWASSPALRNGS